MEGRLLRYFSIVGLVCLLFAAPGFAANPFVDVPLNHWSYDALSGLAAKGIVEGYPDGSFKGNQPMTRYEMATVIARALATVDMEKASKEDVEMLKRLVVEFKDELNALGVKVDELDERVAVLEENLGGWHFFGELLLSANWSDEENSMVYSGVPGYKSGDTEFDIERYRLWMTRKVDDKTTIVMRLGKSGMTDGTKWERYWATVQLPWGFEMMAGRWLYDWELGLYDPIHHDALFTNYPYNGFYLSKKFTTGDIAFFVAHGENSDDPNKDAYTYGLRFNKHFNAKLRLAISGLYKDVDQDTGSIIPGGGPNDMALIDKSVYWADFTVDFTPNIALKGAYWFEDLDVKAGELDDDTPNAYKLAVDVKQEALKFTSLWLEYANFDKNFQRFTFDEDSKYTGKYFRGPYDYSEQLSNMFLPLTYRLGEFETDVYYVSAYQKWTDKWSTFLSYTSVEYGNGTPVGSDYDTESWIVGIKYYYTPSTSFELSYQDVEYGTSEETAPDGRKDDSLIRFRTWIFF